VVGEEAKPNEVKRFGSYAATSSRLAFIIGRLEERCGVDRDPQVAGDPPLMRARQLLRSCAEHKGRLADQGLNAVAAVAMARRR